MQKKSYNLLFSLFLCIALLCTATTDGEGQYSFKGSGQENGFWVFFTDKSDEGFDPYSFFDKKAIERRERHGICLYDPVDLPVRQEYVDSLHTLGLRISVVSRWFNAAHIYSLPDMAFGLEEMEFVRSVSPATLRLVPAMALPEVDLSDKELLKVQQEYMGTGFFRKNGINGSGIRIAIFDAGFRGVDTHAAFSHLNKNGQILDTWDFHRNRVNVYSSSTHGTMVLSAIAGKSTQGLLGPATGADFLLARTEIFREPLAEEQYWLAAAEWADRRGADIINSSLGYVFHRYFPEEMDGQTSLISRAANMAARRGILVVNAAGNMGDNDKWRIIVTPADADSVLSVGALDYPSMLRAAYSSVGPTTDGRPKPNVSALGTIVAAGRRRYATPSGTSFASPQVAAFAACLWQMHPSWSNMQVFNAVERSSTLFPYYDYSHGYGTPQASYFFSDPAAFAAPTFDLVRHNDSLRIVLRERVGPGNSEKKNEYLYYQIRNSDGSIESYFVVDLEEANKIRLNMADLVREQQVIVHYRGHTAGMEVE